MSSDAELDERVRAEDAWVNEQSDRVNAEELRFLAEMRTKLQEGSTMEVMAHHMVQALCDDGTSEIFGDLFCGDGPKGMGAVRNELRRRRPTWEVTSARFTGGRWEVTATSKSDPECYAVPQGLSDDAIARLQDEAARAGDHDQVRLCEIALGVLVDGRFPTAHESHLAREECQRVVQRAKDLDDG